MTGGALFTGEDMILVPIDNGEANRFARIARGHADWEDVVPAINDCALRFDPLSMSAEEARRAAEDALTAFQSAEESGERNAAPPRHVLSAAIGGADGPDAQMVADRLGLADIDALAHWLSTREYKVALIGFQPGFAYLADQSCDPLPEIGRLDSPRQRVKAGSIGFLGTRACLYSLDGPGGWPIIGRVEQRLFDPQAASPALLGADDAIRFETR